MNTKTIAFAAAFLLGLACTLTGCSNRDPLRGGGGSGDGTIVVGSQDYYSNEIIAEIYAQALEEKGYSVDRQFLIGQREVYMPEVESGRIGVIPEYTGSLLQYYRKNAASADAGQIHEQLAKALPKGLTLLDQSEATDQDSYVVTKEFAKKHSLESIGDLARVRGLKLGGNSELETRPFGPKGLKSVYGVDATLTPIEDSGGPLTLKALRSGQVQVVNIFSANPALDAGDLVVLKDPKKMFMPSHVVPLTSGKLPAGAAAVLNRISAELTAEDLVSMNAESVDKGKPAATIASDWLEKHDVA